MIFYLLNFYSDILYYNFFCKTSYNNAKLTCYQDFAIIMLISFKLKYKIPIWRVNNMKRLLIIVAVIALIFNLGFSYCLNSNIKDLNQKVTQNSLDLEYSRLIIKQYAIVQKISNSSSFESIYEYRNSLFNVFNNEERNFIISVVEALHSGWIVNDTDYFLSTMEIVKSDNKILSGVIYEILNLYNLVNYGERPQVVVDSCYNLDNTTMFHVYSDNMDFD